MSDKRTPINANLALQPNNNITAEALELAAKKRMEAELLAFDNAFDQRTTGKN
jgi:phage major head subunit gpT-like protein